MPIAVWIRLLINNTYFMSRKEIMVMNEEKKEYVSPKYRVVKIDANNIINTTSPGTDCYEMHGYPTGTDCHEQEVYEPVV